MAYVNLDSLCKRVKSLIHEILEECQILEDGFVAFFQILFFQICWQVLQERLLFYNVEVLLDVDTLLDVIIDLPFKLVRQIVLVRQLLQGFRVLELLDILRTNVTDESSN